MRRAHQNSTTCHFTASVSRVPRQNLPYVRAFGLRCVPDTVPHILDVMNYSKMIKLLYHFEKPEVILPAGAAQSIMDASTTQLCGHFVSHLLACSVVPYVTYVHTGCFLS